MRGAALTASILSGNRLVAKMYGNWKVESKLASSGQAEVFLVTRIGGLCTYVLKRYRNQARLCRTMAELNALSKLHHPQILRLVDSHVDPWPAYVVTEHCKGGTLRDRHSLIFSLSIEEKLLLFRSICIPVAYVHAQGYVHRDLKPDNIFARSDNSIVIGDFGLCYCSSDDDRNTDTWEAVGPRYYISPELEDGRANAVLPASDVYSLGKLLCWILCKREFSREKHRIPGIQPDFGDDREFEEAYRILDRMIVENPAERMPNATEVVAAIDNLIADVRGWRNITRVQRDTSRIIEITVNAAVVDHDAGLNARRLLGFSSLDSRSCAYGLDDTGSAWVANRRDGNKWSIYSCPASQEFCRPQSMPAACIHISRKNGTSALVYVCRIDSSNHELCIVDIPDSTETASIEPRIRVRSVTPRNLSIAVDQHVTAVCIGGMSSRTELLVHDGSEIRNYDIARCNFPCPIAFGPDGVLHGAIVTEKPGSTKGHRILRYWKWSRGVNIELIDVDSSPDRDANLSGNISIAVDALNRPVIVGRWISATKDLLVYTYDKGRWQDVRIPMRPTIDRFRMRSIDLSGPKHVVCHSDQTTSIAIAMDSQILYLRCAADWCVSRAEVIEGVLAGMGTQGSASAVLSVENPS